MRSDARSAADAMGDLLEEEHRALLAADLSALSRLAERKQVLTGRLCGGAEEVELSDLRARAARNAALYDSVLQGIRAAAHRLREVRAVRRVFATYDSAGGRATLAPGGDGRLERKA